MLCSQLLLLCAAVPVILASFVDEEETSLVQLTVERNWKRGKAKPNPAPAEDDVEDDISFMQTKVTNEHRIKPVSEHSFDCHHVAARATLDGNMDVAEEATHRDRSPLEMDDGFSLVQVKAEHQSRAAGFEPSDTGQHFDFDDDADAEVMEVSLLQTHLNVQRRPVGPTLTLETSAAVSFFPVDTIAATPHKADDHDEEVISAVAASDAEKTWLGRFCDKLSVKAWELHEWASFALCLLLLGCVILKATQTGGLKPKDLRMIRSWGASALPVPPRRLSLTLPLRQLLDRDGGPVKLFGSSGGLAYVATLLEDELGERTLQLAEAAEPAQVIMSVGPLSRSGVLEDSGMLTRAAVHRHTTGHTLGTLQSTGPNSWSLIKNGQTTLQLSSSAPFTLAISAKDSEATDVAWVKPLSEAKEPDYVDLSVVEGGEPMLPVACAVAVLVASASRPCEGEEQDEDI